MTNHSTSIIAKSINSLLRTLGIQLIKTSTLEDLHSQIACDATSSADTKNDGQELYSNDSRVLQLENRLAALESYSLDSSIKNLVNYTMKAHWRSIDKIEQISGDNQPSNCALCRYEPEQNSEFKVITSESIFQGGKLIRHQCPKCDVIFGPQKMLTLDHEMLDLEYRNLYRIYSEGDTTESTIRTFHLLSPKKEGKYLDFGCGGEWSAAIEKLRSLGWDILGFEPSASNSSEFVLSRWEEIESMSFDGIISHNVLEHLLDPVQTTQRLSTLLKPKGTLIHSTPCFEYLYEFSHLHVFFFLGKSAETLAEMSGMKILDWVKDDQFVACSMNKLANT